MENGLSGIRACIDDKTIAKLADIILLSQPACNEHQMPEQRFIFLVNVIQRGNVALGNNQQVNRGRRMPVGKNRYLFILIDKIAGRRAGNNLAKNTVFGHYRY